MKISTILSNKGRDVYSISADATLADVLKEMLSLNIGCLLILNENGAVEGIFTERDFLHNVAKHPDNWETVKLSDVMNRDVIVCALEKTLEQVMAKMSKNRIRHIPISDAGKIVGVLSIGDIISASLEETEFQNKLLKRYIEKWPEQDISESTT